MQIVGITNNSFVDYPGHIAMVVFLAGCNMNCYYCHNRDIIGKNKSNVLYAPELIIKNLEGKKDFLDGIVITGGEPTLYDDLPDFMREIKEKTSKLIKLDTNGTNPKMLELVLQENLVDFVAMDIKAPPDKYNETSGAKIDLEKIERSIEIIKKSDIDYEFRTTYAPSLEEADIVKLAKWITKTGEVKKYALQQYRNPNVQLIDNRLLIPAHPKEYLTETLEKIKEIIPNSVIRGI